MEQRDTVLTFAKEYIAAGIKCLPVELARKKPRNSAWSTKFLDYTAFESIFVSGDGIGIVTGKESGIICIDIDNKPGRSAVGWYHSNEDMLGSPLVEHTPSGGLHLYYKYPKGIEFLKSNKDIIFHGVEFMADGGRYVITAPSTKYVMHNDIRLNDIAFEGSIPPQWIIELAIGYHQKKVENPSAEGDPAVDVSRCIDHIKHLPPAVENHSGDLQTFKAACRCRDHGLTQAQAFTVLLEHYNPRCVPPWSHVELRAKVKNAYKYNRAEKGALVSNPAMEFKEEVVEVVEQKKNAPPRYVKTNILDFVGKHFPPKEHIIGPFVKQGLNMVYAPPGVGKTYFSMSLAYAIATRGEFLHWKCEAPQSVIYFDGEMPANEMQERLKALLKNNPSELLPFDIVTGEEQSDTMPDFSTLEGQQAAMGLIGDSQFIVIDNISCLCRTGKENEAESWITVQNFLLRLRHKGKSVLLVHHSGKGEGGTQRGTSKREDALDLIIKLSHSPDHKASEGCSFNVEYPKARHYRKERPDDLKEIKASYVDFGWVVEGLEESSTEKVLKLLEQGMKNQKDIVAASGVRQPQVSKIMAKFKKEGLRSRGNDQDFNDPF